MGRPRTRPRLQWPDNITTGGGGYIYRHPKTGKRTYLGRNQKNVFEAARKLNAMLMGGNILVAKVTGRNETIDDAIELFRGEDKPEREWKESTDELYENILVRMSKAIGDRELTSLTVRDCATFVQDVTASKRARQQFRLALQWVLACAVEQGWIETNPALQIRKAVFKRQRERLTKDTYDKIYEKAPQWLRNAMDISLNTLLRREDVVSLRFTDTHDNAIWVIPGKTEGTTGARLKVNFAADSELANVLARCRDEIISPYLVHCLPRRLKAKQQRAKERDHHTQVLPEQLSRAFAVARSAAGIEGDNPPTFHEIRSLGGALLIQAGWTKKQVQNLMTHTSESMTEHYLEGHDLPWTEVQVS